MHWCQSWGTLSSIRHTWACHGITSLPSEHCITTPHLPLTHWIRFKYPTSSHIDIIDLQQLMTWLMQQFRYQKYFWPSRKLPVTLRMTALSVRWKICLFGQLSFYLHTAPLVSTGALSVIKYKPSISPASVHPMLTVGGVTISWPLSGAECCCCCCWVLIS